MSLAFAGNSPVTDEFPAQMASDTFPFDGIIMLWDIALSPRRAEPDIEKMNVTVYCLLPKLLSE